MKLIGTRASSKPLYAALGLPENATAAEIRDSFICIAMAHHPDFGSGPSEVFMEAMHAYGVLSDPAMRRLYDRHGLDVDGPDSLKKEATVVICNALMQVLGSTEYGTNPVAAVRSALLSELNEMVQSREGMSGGVVKVERGLLDIESRWSGAEEMKEKLLKMIRARLVLTRDELEKLDRNIRIERAALMLLELVNYQMPSPVFGISRIRGGKCVIG